MSVATVAHLSLVARPTQYSAPRLPMLVSQSESTSAHGARSVYPKLTHKRAIWQSKASSRAARNDGHKTHSGRLRGTHCRLSLPRSFCLAILAGQKVQLVSKWTRQRICSTANHAGSGTMRLRWKVYHGRRWATVDRLAHATQRGHEYVYRTGNKVGQWPRFGVHAKPRALANVSEMLARLPQLMRGWPHSRGRNNDDRATINSRSEQGAQWLKHRLHS